jgi:hypothetical protein
MFDDLNVRGARILFNKTALIHHPDKGGSAVKFA